MKSLPLAAFTAAALLTAPLMPAGPLAGMSAAHAAPAGGVTSNRAAYRLSRAGSRRGNYCAFYKGRNTFEEFPLAQSISRRACFQTARACKSWFYKVQSAFPISGLRKPCRRS